jgi:hypothetical protein
MCLLRVTPPARRTFPVLMRARFRKSQTFIAMTAERERAMGRVVVAR